jgi:molybdenum cofactor cytidylyltransferase
VARDGMSEQFRLGVVLLAAGASSRMGRPKLLLPWGGGTVLEHLLRQWIGAGATQIGIVCAATNEPLIAALDALKFKRENRIINPKPEAGMFSSIQAAANWTGWNQTLTHWAVTLGDQPQVQSETLAQAISFADENPTSICQPSRNGRPRHPVILPRQLFLELRQTAETNLKEFLVAREAHRKLIAANDPGLDWDLDSPQDYERAQRMFFSDTTIAE